MRIALLNGSTIYPLAGQAGVAERLHSSAGELRIDAGIATQTERRVRARAALTRDRKNLSTSISWSTSRQFATPLLAALWAADYDETFPRSGILILDFSAIGAVPASITVGGDLTTDGSTPAVFPILAYAGLVNARPAYEDPLAGGCSVMWMGSSWLVSHTGDMPLFSSAQTAATPDLVTSWTPVGAATGTPVPVGSYADSRYLLDAVVAPPSRQVIGCSVELRYSATGGILATEISGTWSAEIP